MCLRFFDPPELAVDADAMKVRQERTRLTLVTLEMLLECCDALRW